VRRLAEDLVRYPGPETPEPTPAAKTRGISRDRQRFVVSTHARERWQERVRNPLGRPYAHDAALDYEIEHLIEQLGRILPARPVWYRSGEKYETDSVYVGVGPDVLLPCAYDGPDLVITTCVVASESRPARGIPEVELPPYRDVAFTSAQAAPAGGFYNSRGYWIPRDGWSDRFLTRVFRRKKRSRSARIVGGVLCVMILAAMYIPRPQDPAPASSGQPPVAAPGTAHRAEGPARHTKRHAG
jgi:hypothetical protein